MATPQGKTKKDVITSARRNPDERTKPAEGVKPVQEVKPAEVDERELDDSFSIVHRNLALAYVRVEQDLEKALASMTAYIVARVPLVVNRILSAPICPKISSASPL